MMRVLITLLLFSTITHAQGQLIFGQVSVVQNCIWAGTAEPSLQNVKVEFYKEIAAVSVTGGVLAKYRVSVVPAPYPAASATTQPAQPTTANVTFLNVPVVSDHYQSFQVGEQNCVTQEVALLKDLVALNSAAVDAVLTKYRVQLVDTDGKRVFPR